MREDIKKLFSNQYHSYYKEKFPRTSKKYCKTDVDGEPIESLKKPYILSGDRHYGADLDYNFFRRLLMGNVGKNWDEVYSEICKQTDLRNFVGKAKTLH